MSVLADTLNKGKAAAAKAASKANAAVNDYRIVPGFKDYELNSKDIASKSNKSKKFSGISGAMNRTENPLADKFFGKKAGDDKTSIKALKNKVEDKKQTQHTRQKH